jgi:hypothetical protein
MMLKPYPMTLIRAWAGFCIRFTQISKPAMDDDAQPQLVLAIPQVMPLHLEHVFNTGGRPEICLFELGMPWKQVQKLCIRPDNLAIDSLADHATVLELQIRVQRPLGDIYAIYHKYSIYNLINSLKFSGAWSERTTGGAGSVSEECKTFSR